MNECHQLKRNNLSKVTEINYALYRYFKASNNFHELYGGWACIHEFSVTQ